MMFEKTKTTEIQRLRAAGFSLAKAERLAQNRRGPGFAIAASVAGALLLGSAIVTIGFDLTRDTPGGLDLAQMSVAPALPAEQDTTAPLQETQPVSDAALAQAALRDLQQNLITQSTVASDQTETLADDAQTTRAAGGVSAALNLDQAAVPTQEIVAASDCVADLSTLVRGAVLPFGVARTDVPTPTPPLLDLLSTELGDCPQARLMITGHSDGTGEETINIQLSWERADATMARLVALGAAPEQLEVIGFGTRVPVSPDAAAAAPENRRVDFRVSRREEISG